MERETFFWAWYKLKFICLLYFHFVPSPEKVSHAKLYPWTNRGGGFLVLLQLFSALILRLFSAYSPHSKAAAHGALLSRGAAERRPLGRSQAVKVSDRLNLSIPDLGLKRPANELDMVMRVVWCTHRTSRHGHPRPNALWIRSVLYS